MELLFPKKCKGVSLTKRFLQLMDISIQNDFEEFITHLPYKGTYSLWGERIFFIAPAKLKYGNGFALVEWYN